MNKTIVLGNVGNVPRLTKLQDGNEVMNFSLAHTVKQTDKDTGEIKSITTWFDCSYFFKKDASKEISKYIIKGNPLLVEGKIKADFYMPQDAKSKSDIKPVLKLTVKNITLAGQKNRSESTSAENNNSDDLPF